MLTDHHLDSTSIFVRKTNNIARYARFCLSIWICSSCEKLIIRDTCYEEFKKLKGVSDTPSLAKQNQDL